ncbi:prenyltransferase/squalene oxidase repeat-containing protein [Streptomyces sp. NPDC058257]|uniref:prenyltransferase/squalene oxidase repeat-containing protein n=1 Tax=Streptomyces sp. NPDC058257 TaxID=3346409 RepID=UPI0036F17D07
MRVRELPPDWKPWSPDMFPEELPAATDLLCAHVQDQVDHQGALRDPCHGRVLESALLLRLMERTAYTSPAKTPLTTYLESRREAADPLDRLLVDTSLDHHAAADPRLTGHFLSQVPEFTAPRKRLLIDALLTVFGAQAPANRSLRPGDFTTVGLHSWAAVQVTALKLILAADTGRRDLVREGDIELLLSTQRTAWVWEGNILIHLFVLHALLPYAGSHDTVHDGIGKALTHQRADGSLPFIVDTDTWCTATAGVALRAAGARGSDLERMARHLTTQQRPNGGWAFTDRAQQTDADDIAVTVEFLHALDPRKYADEIAQGTDSLLGVRDFGGGFPTYLAGAPPEPCMTAAAVNALSTDAVRHRDTIAQGLGFLAEQQHADGSFAPDWSASRHHTLFRSVLAGGSLGEDPPPPVRRMTARALGTIHDTQNDDGGWGRQPGEPSDAISTSYALIALCRQQDPAPAVRGVTYLLTQQRKRGEIRSVPDSIGPRPFVFTVPVLADIFALLALGHLRHRLGPSLAPGATHN